MMDEARRHFSRMPTAREGGGVQVNQFENIPWSSTGLMTDQWHHMQWLDENVPCGQNDRQTRLKTYSPTFSLVGGNNSRWFFDGLTLSYLE